MPRKPFEFQVGEDEVFTLENAVFQALGAASMCWSETPNGVFDGERAKEIGDRLVAWVRTHPEQHRAQKGAFAPPPSRWQPLSLPQDVDPELVEGIERAITNPASRVHRERPKRHDEPLTLDEEHDIYTAPDLT